jgi:hypothetical protein
MRIGTVTFPPRTTTQTIRIAICGDNTREIDETFTVHMANAVNGNITIAEGTCTIRNDDTILGQFELGPSDFEVEPHETAMVAFGWTVPEPLSWHDLADLELRVTDGDALGIQLRFDEETQGFALFDERTGRYGKYAQAGDHKRLETRFALLDLAETSVVAAGPTSPTVTLQLALSFKPSAVGHPWQIEVAASDDFGQHDGFAPAGSVIVTAGRP